MCLLGKWQVVETPEHDMAGANSYILFGEEGGAIGLLARVGPSPLVAAASISATTGKCLPSTEGASG